MIFFKWDPGFGKFQSLKNCIRSFGFKENMQQKGKLIKKDSAFIADVIASLMKTLRNTKRVSEELTRRALTACRDIIQSLGFQQISFDLLFRSLDKNRLNIITTYGCQTDDLLKNRVRATVDLYCSLSGEINLFFSGLRPNPKKPAAIPNEAQSMATSFNELLSRKQSRLNGTPRISEILIESESTRTEENMEKLLSHVRGLSDRKSSASTNKLNLFLVSSTFHDIKIAEAFEAQVKKTSFISSNDIFLVGAEPIDKLNKVSSREEYTKALYFHLYDFLIRNDTV